MRDVLIDTDIDAPEGKYRVVYRNDKGQEWPYAYDSVGDAAKGIENWLAGRRVEDSQVPA